MTKDKYARAVGNKGLGNAGSSDWLIKDMSEELKAWGHPGGADSVLVCKRWGTCYCLCEGSSSKIPWRTDGARSPS